ncbi:23040_t:CDS:2 [Gigaspora margarita]|uniref:23040_t:CDS:1 n=1 Tax=Gigaspora margarita TaxID=4874 RepID=A0ABN7VLF2_GIGMA|nr:23040_t:CDS:2 [Gigaspora margarita]
MLDIKGWRDLFIKRNPTEIEQSKTKEIALRIEKRCEIIENQQGRMIKSLLNKPFRKVTIDKYISKNGLNNKIVLDSEEIKLKVNNHFQNQFRKRSVKLVAMPSNWKSVYEPKKKNKEGLVQEGITEYYTKLRLQMGMYKARIINDSWSPIELPKLNQITPVRNQQYNTRLKEKDNARALNLVFNELFDARIANGLEKLNLFYLDQLTDSNDQCLLFWPKIIRSGGKTRGKKPKYISLPEISNDKRKKEWVLSEEGEAFKIKEKKEKTIQVEHWRTVSEVAKSKTRIEKCSGCEYNRSIVEGNCTTRIKSDVGWKVISNNTISRIESSTQMQANFNLALLARETYHKNPLVNKQEFKKLCSLESSKKELIL